MRRLIYDIRRGVLCDERGGSLRGFRPHDLSYIEAYCAKQLRLMRGYKAETRRVDGHRIRIVLPPSPAQVRPAWDVLPSMMASAKIVEIEFRRLAPEAPRRPADRARDEMLRLMRNGDLMKWMKPGPILGAFRMSPGVFMGNRMAPPPAPPLIEEMPGLPPAEAPKPALQKRSRWEDGNHFIDHLVRRGFRTLGRGAFSTVLAKPGSDKVIKVCRNLDAWPEYVMWATKNGYAGTWAPRVYSFHQIEGTRHSFYVAVVERLGECVFTVEDERPEVGALYNGMAHFIRGRDEYGVDVGKRDPGALVFALAFRLFKRGVTAGLDLHGGNWMLKGKRLVLTDPLCDGKPSSTPSRLRSKALAALAAH